MLFRLSSMLEVYYRNRSVTFYHRQYNIRITLSYHQFENLHDFVTTKGILSNYIPLGNGTWFIYPYTLCSSVNYIRIGERCWKKYIWFIHYRIRSLFQHDSSRKQYVRAHSRYPCRFEHYSSIYPSKYTISRKTSNDSDSFRTQEKCTNFSLRQSSNYGKTFSFRDAVDGLQYREKIEKDIYESDSLSTNTEESCSVSSVE